MIYGDEKNCLDPSSTLRVYSPLLRAATGEAVRLRLFANRKDTPMRYKWIVQSAPSGSEAVVENPRGTVLRSTPFEYHYIKNNVAAFTPDEPGTYQIKLVTELVFPDPINAAFPRNAAFVATVEAEGDSMGGCSVGNGAGGAGAALLTLLGLGLLRLRRRRR